MKDSEVYVATWENAREAIGEWSIENVYKNEADAWTFIGTAIRMELESSPHQETSQALQQDNVKRAAELWKNHSGDSYTVTVFEVQS